MMACNQMDAIFRRGWLATLLGLSALSICLAKEKPSVAGQSAVSKTAGEQNISIGYEATVIKTGYLEQNRRGQAEPLASPVTITVQNRSGRPATTSVAMTGKDAELATVELAKTVETADGQDLHLRVLGQRFSTAESETFLTIEVKQDGEVKAAKSLLVRVVVPATVKTGDPVIYEGPTIPGLVNRALNMRTYPKAAVAPPEAKLANMCLHDLKMQAFDQFGEPLPEIYQGAPVFAALGEEDYETTNRSLTKSGTWIDTAGLWQFVGEIANIETEPGKTEVAKFIASPAAPMSEAQYRAYEPLTLQWQIGGFPVGTYLRQITLLDSGDDHKPNIRITLVPKKTSDAGSTTDEN
jgi:hypothetical protein